MGVRPAVTCRRTRRGYPLPVNPPVTPPTTPAPRSRARMLELVFPKDTNYHGTAFGGWVLALMDKAASVAAVRHAGGNVVTARMDAVDFHVPIRVGDAVALDARVIKVGRSSMTIRVDVYRENMASGEQQLATSGLFIFVALDENGKPRPVPALAEGNTESEQPDYEARP
ncbi:hypothetical protein GCM10010914_24370 [Deinococcus wulumuqiensis]|uniref:HotDog ACOT-type domain-containing protein n=2 Tax=Deinococcus wulumuqiensis TaxID=980427 RepID=A0AAV4K995_9DEIO|nr:hypothetical protein GCM10010914_24370 [Deinococcus wulumuqiensis]GGP30482.1 hypothetical protein GCM10008021_21330 [Deinococcus wulumuqiensis]